jgi:hypothetical protein
VTADNEKPEDYLYHYTNAGAILGMIQRRKFWATSYDYLNDGMEGRLVSARLKRFVERPGEHRALAASPKYAEVLGRTLKRGRHYYVASFSRHRDMLTQFRMYCPPAGGFVIGFPRSVLEKMGSVLEVNYNKAQLEVWCQAYVTRLVDTAARLDSPEKSAEQLELEMSKAHDWSGERALEGIRHKQREFSTEAEVRVVKTGVVPHLLRPSADGHIFVNYTELEIPNEKFKVLIAPGPGRSWQLAQQSIGSLVHAARAAETVWQIAILSIGQMSYRTL